MDYEPLFSMILTEGNDYLKCCGFKGSPLRKFFFYTISFLSLGTVNLLCYWKPYWKVRLTKVRCSLCEASQVVVQDINDVSIEDVIVEDFGIRNCDTNGIRNKDGERYFEHRCLRFYWSNQDDAFVQLRGFEARCVDLLEGYDGLTDEKFFSQKCRYGQNTIDIKVKSYWKLFIEEVLNPFYIFQILSITLWCLDDYYYYATCIFAISCFSLGVSLHETKKQSQTLHDMVAANSVNVVTVSRKGEGFIAISALDVVPGDILVIPDKSSVMCCDAVLITGNCIVNESMLTGESIPVTKTPLLAQDDAEMYCTEMHKRHTLYSGTEIVQTRYYGHDKVLAVVVRTGFLTAKGELVRSIMFPKPVGFAFYKDSIRFILVLFVMSICGMIYSVYIYISRGASVKEIILRGLDIFTIVVPPALPAAMTVGTAYAQNRLKKKGIFCISPPRINISGKTKVICFDKTGTLTEDGLDLYGILPVDKNTFQDVVHNPSSLPIHNIFLAAMASCHSLTLMNGKIAGDPLDIKMFESTYWDLEEPGEDSNRFDLLMPTVVRPRIQSSYQNSTLLISNSDDYMQELISKDVSNENNAVAISNVDLKQIPYEIGIVRQFTFSSSLQRMSVIVRRLGAENMDVYVKGAPEKIISLCTPSSIPKDFSEVLHGYSISGLRVLAMAYKPLPSKVTWHHSLRTKRDQVECDLQFLGLLMMQNALKPETTPVIKELHDADLRTIMVTGDNMLTAVSVARNCLMIPTTNRVIYLHAYPGDGNQESRIEWELEEEIPDLASKSGLTEFSDNSVPVRIFEDFHVAIDGKSFAIIKSCFPDDYQKVLIKAKVFARMSPDQKTQLVEDLQDLKYIVCMCGDGANDCGALKAAHVGISLSEAEASVAAPFTSKIQNIECVPQLIREGRCALVTSFGVFKYMALYSMIQFISILILYTEGALLSDMMFLYIDLCITTTAAVLMGITGPYKKLVSRRPIGSLVSFVTISSVVLQILISLIVQLGTLYFLRQQKWFVKGKIVGNDRIIAWETTFIFCISSYQYLILATVFCKGPPFRNTFFSNIYFMSAVVVLIGISTVLLFEPIPVINSFFKMKGNITMHVHFKICILIIAFINFVISALIESIVSSMAFKQFSNILTCKKQPKNLYKRLIEQIDYDVFWPSVECRKFSSAVS